MDYAPWIAAIVVCALFFAYRALCVPARYETLTEPLVDDAPGDTKGCLPVSTVGM